MTRFGLTGMVVAKADRNRDPYEHIDHLRQEVFDQGQALDALEMRVRTLEIAEQERLTKTGAWTYVKSQLNEGAVDWQKWAFRGLLAGACGGIFTLTMEIAKKFFG